MKTRTLAFITFAFVAAVPVTAAIATPPSGLSSQLLGRGAAQDELKLAVPTRVVVTELRKVRIKGKVRTKKVRVSKIVDRALVTCGSATPCDVAAVRATLAAGGSTGWHSHPLPSLVIVKAGSLTMREPRAGQCSTREFTAGQAFIHPAGPHIFSNAGTTELEFYVAYFAPVGAGLLIDAPAPTECP